MPSNGRYRKIDVLLAAEHSCARMLVRALDTGSPKKMTQKAFMAGRDSRTLFDHGLAKHRRGKNIVFLTHKARKMLGE